MRGHIKFLSFSAAALHRRRRRFGDKKSAVELRPSSAESSRVLVEALKSRAKLFHVHAHRYERNALTQNESARTFHNTETLLSETSNSP
jgi:hypothetical protein